MLLSTVCSPRLLLLSGAPPPRCSEISAKCSANVQTRLVCARKQLVHGSLYKNVRYCIRTVSSCLPGVQCAVTQCALN